MDINKYGAVFGFKDSPENCIGFPTTLDQARQCPVCIRFLSWDFGCQTRFQVLSENSEELKTGSHPEFSDWFLVVGIGSREGGGGAIPARQVVGGKGHPTPAVPRVNFSYMGIALKVSYTETLAPSFKIGQVCANITAESIESAWMIEYPLGMQPSESSIIIPSLVMLFTLGPNGFPASTRALPILEYQSSQACIAACCSDSLSGMLPPE